MGKDLCRVPSCPVSRSGVRVMGVSPAKVPWQGSGPDRWDARSFGARTARRRRRRLLRRRASRRAGPGEDRCAPQGLLFLDAAARPETHSARGPEGLAHSAGGPHPCGSGPEGIAPGETGRPGPSGRSQETGVAGLRVPAGNGPNAKGTAPSRPGMGALWGAGGALLRGAEEGWCQ